jgi:conjugal transfer mating pair stabilization protein TraN
MKILHKIACAFVLLSSLACAYAQTLTTSSAFNEGKSFGDTGKNGAKNAVQHNSATTSVPGFTYSASEGGYFNGGTGVLSAPSANKAINCQTAVPGSAYAAQECSAINYMKGLPSGWAMNSNNPKIQAVLSSSSPTVANPGPIPGNATGTYCKVVSRTSPGSHVTETCNRATQTSFPKCDKKRHVQIKWDYTCPVGAISAPYPAAGSTTVPPEHLCTVQHVTKQYKCNATDTLVDTNPPYESWMCKGPGDVLTPPTVVDFYSTTEELATPVPTVIQSWVGDCEPLEIKSDKDHLPHPTCEELSMVCTEGEETRYFDGVPVHNTCWKKHGEFACLTDKVTAECDSIQGKSCQYLGTTCIQYSIDNKCAIEQDTYSCVHIPPVTTTETVCTAPTYCDGTTGACFETTSPPDQEFAIAAAGMEAQRQAGVYTEGFQIFRGTDASCKIKVLGGSTISSCCKGTGGGGAYKNSTVMNLGISASFTVVGEAGKEAVRAGSSYVYDALYSSVDGSFMSKGLSAMKDWGGGIGDGLFNPTFSLYGFQFQFSFANGFQFTGFDPWSFAFAVVIAIIQEWLSCDQNDQMTMIKRGANLCVHVGTYCSKKMKIIKTCLEKTEQHCCFNSVLAKIVNRQGGAQIGKNPMNCGGFTEAEFEKINFAAIDYSEFIAEIGNPGTGEALANARTVGNVNRLTTNYYTTGSQK